jgi:pyruvate-ferredoxin/flavodoxin oxidoreductase
VGANKNSIKIIGEDTPYSAQGYFVYDSRKSGTHTTSHLRFGPRPIRSSYLVSKANFIACHQFSFLEKYELLEPALPGATFLLNAPHSPETVWDHLPFEVQRRIIDKGLKFHVIDAYQVARDTGMGVRINTIMQVCFFALSGVLPRDEAIEHIKRAIEKTYGRKGEAIVRKNFEAVDHTLAHLHEVRVPRDALGKERRPVVPRTAPDFVQRVTAPMLAGKGDLLPVSALPVDGTWPTGTTKWEKRSIAAEIPVLDKSLCIQCNKCTLICPHAGLRVKFYSPEVLRDAPETFVSWDFKSVEHKGTKYSLQVSPEDCTGCALCVEMCPAESKTEKGRKALAMRPKGPLLEAERRNFEFFLGIPEADRSSLKLDVKNAQFLQPLFEYSGACTGCGETPYVKLLTQLYGDRAIIANATGCSSIFGGNLPTAPYTVNAEGRGPAWSNSLFEDNAEFGFGMRLAVDKQAEQARELLGRLAAEVGGDLARDILAADQSSEAGIASQRERVRLLKDKLARLESPEAAWLRRLADQLVKKSVWIVGGDGWAYDIGYGGLDHVIAMGKDVNILVLDTEVYSNTGGQASKATPMGASAKFAMAGKRLGKKDLALLAMTYGHAYVARVAIGAKDAQTVNAFKEAESYPGTSVIIAYCHCIAHGFEISEALEHQDRAVASGYWPLFRYDPRRATRGESPLKLDSPPPKIPFAEFANAETRFSALERVDAAGYQAMLAEAEHKARERYTFYEKLAKAMDPAEVAAGKAAVKS